ncbi:hypothetical protein ACFL5X_04075 [Candidatus Omnitrophota bacterium]
MRNLTFLIFIITFVTAAPAFALSKDPFAIQLPAEQAVLEEAIDVEGTGEGEVGLPLEPVLQGLFWGTGRPQVILNDRVYSEREKIEGTEVEIVKIEQGSVHLFYKGKVFVIFPKRSK